jgi:soluble lytic murein transglycosylase
VLVASGRFWHARRVTPPPTGTRALPADSIVIHATIAAGLGRDAEVEQLLRRARGADTSRALLQLAAQADERAGRWADAVRRYRRLLAHAATTDDERERHLVRLALALEQTGPRDSAAATWRRAAAALPGIADWLAVRRAAMERDTAVAFAAVAGMRTRGAARRADLAIAGRRLALGNARGALPLFARSGGPLDVAHAELALGRRREARARANAMLAGDPARPETFLAALFLTEHFDRLAPAELLAVSRAYRAQRDAASAERFARSAMQRGDTSPQPWLEVAAALAQRGDVAGALRAVDSAGTRREGRRQPMRIAAARLQVLTGAARWDEADTALVLLARRHPGDTTVARLVMLFADHYRQRGEVDAERARYDLLLSRFAAAPAAVAARFRLALIAYAEGARDSAAALIDAVVALDTTGRAGLGPRYWRARLAAERGDAVAATLLRAIADSAPTQFYGVRARELAGDPVVTREVALPLPQAGSFAPAQARERIRQLARVGLDAEARAEAAGFLQDSTASVQLLTAAGEAAGEAGFAREAILLGEAVRRRVGLTPGAARALFPYPFRRIIEAEADEHCVDPLLMAALIRQESRFETRAVSRAGARGLSQVMPATAAEMAERLRLGAWDAELLFVPDANLHLGARYIQERLERDALPLHALLASYNAGPARVARWRRWRGFEDPDLFAERVTIAETRDYVRTVYANYAWYRAAWADTEDWSFPR